MHVLQGFAQLIDIRLDLRSGERLLAVLDLLVQVLREEFANQIKGLLRRSARGGSACARVCT